MQGAGPARWLRRFGTGVTVVGLTLLGAVTLFCLLAELHWFFDLFTHFRLQYLAAVLLLAAVGFLAAARRLALLALLLALPHVWALQSLFYGATPQAAAAAPATAGATADRFTLTSLNVNWSHRDPQRGVDYLRRTQPDIVVLQEAARAWVPVLPQLVALYPHVLPEGWENGGNILILSRFPLRLTKLDIIGDDLTVLLSAERSVGDRRLDLVGLHPVPAVGSGNAWMRNRTFENTAEIAMLADKPVLVAGDFNSTPWSPHFTGMLQAGGLHSAAAGRGWLPTWLAEKPLFALPIDHILGNDRVAFEHFERGPDLGSDHLPITATFRILP